MALTSIGQNLKENGFALKVLGALKSRNFEDYKKVMVNKKDLEELFADLAKNDKIMRLQDPPNNPLERFDKEADSTFRAEFNRIIRKGESLGIDWAHVDFSDFIYKADKPVNSSKTSLNGHLNFTYNGSTYVLFGIEALELANGYKLNGIRTVQKGGVKEYVDPDLLDDEDL